MDTLSPAERETLRTRLRRQPAWWSFGGWAVVVCLFALPALRTLHRRTPIDLSGVPPVEVNTADSLTLLSLPGMKPWTVSRLLYLRASLGGFRDTAEVRAVLDSAHWLAIAGDITVYSLFQPPGEPINLNTADSATLVRAGLCRPSIARSLIKYRYRVGGFTDWAQIDSFRGLNALERYRVRTYAVPGEIHAPARAQKEKKAPPIIDLNTATAEMLERLPGIGAKSAARIIRYREKLGFFTAVEQVKEVWGLHPENLEKALPYLMVRSVPAPRLSLRRATVEELAAHPYVSWKLARQLVRMRERYGGDAIPPEVWIEWLPDSVRTRLKPYLTGE